MTIEIGSLEWLEARRSLITATDAPIIMGMSPWKTPLQLFYDKLNGTQSEQTHAMKRGLALEDDARKAFEALTGELVSPEFRVSKAVPWMAATYDGINDNGIIVEIKCPGEEDHALALEGIVPEKYKAQCQHQLLVAEADHMFYFSFRPNDVEPCAIVRVVADPSFQAKMLMAEEEFWELMQTKTPPEPGPKDIQVREDRTWLMMEEEILSLTNDIATLEKRRDELRKKMISLCDGKPTRGYRVKFVPIETRGSIDYSAIEMLKNVNLEIYRKPASIRWRMDEL